jgi:phage tail-like protein
MNVNGSRFHLLLGKADWERCVLCLGDGAEPASPPADPPLVFDVLRRELRLPQTAIALPATLGETPLSQASRRSAAADRNGNIYRIDTDRTRLRVQSAGSGNGGPFWPDGPTDCDAPHRSIRSDFVPADAPAESRREFAALTVTEDHYLVVAFADAAARGFLAFDLMAGGPPVETRWPAAVDFAPFDMAPRRGGGAWVLDRDHRRLWELDRRLAVVVRAQSAAALAPPETDLFQPVAGAQRERPAVEFPAGLDLPALFKATLDPIAVEALPDGSALILDRNDAAGPSRVFRLRREGDAVAADPAVALVHAAHDFVLAHPLARAVDGGAESLLAADAVQLLAANAVGNQAMAFVVDTRSGKLELHQADELFPLRRFGGRALLQVRGGAWYDCGADSPRWVPIVQQPRVRYREGGERVTPVFDGQEAQCGWDRVMLDARIPADTAIAIAFRAADEAVRDDGSPPGRGRPVEVLAPWIDLPQPYLRGDGAELPWLRSESAMPTRREAGAGTWETLLQNAKGRYLQLRLRFNGAATPWLRALRVWYPRFSYSERFLPAVYREDPAAGDFVERFLANMEGVNTVLEGRIAQVQALFDPRTAPAGALDWLAGWLDLALNPAWDQSRRRLFLRHAMDFFRWRGTAHGLRLALAMAFEANPCELTFAEPTTDSERPAAIRIVEAYRTRLTGAVAAGDPGGAETGPRQVAPTALWTPAEGNAGLVERYARFLQGNATAAQQAIAFGRALPAANADGQPVAAIAEQLAPFALVPPPQSSSSQENNAAAQTLWARFCAENLGLVPGPASQERQAWRRFLATRDEATAPAASSALVPADWPEDAAAQTRWRDYCESADMRRAWPQLTRLRRRWQDFLARRYRRIDALKKAWRTAWPAFDLIALPDRLPESAAAQADWLAFERHWLAMDRAAHRFSVLLPVASVTEDPFEMERNLALARRIVELEKPAHTVFDVRFYWALNRVGEARLGIDTLLDVGSRAPQLVPDAVLGRAYLGAGFVGGPQAPDDGDRKRLAC